MRCFLVAAVIAGCAGAPAPMDVHRDALRCNVRFEPWLSFAGHDIVEDLQAVDLDGDGWVDIVVSESNYSLVSVFYNHGDHFTEPAALPTGHQPYPLAIADFNHDGRLDIATGGAPDTSILFSREDGGFSAPFTVPDSGEDAITGLIGADLDGDGYPDLVVGSNYRQQLYASKGTATPGQFESWWRYDAGDPIGPSRTGDLNGDGLVDGAFTVYFWGVAIVLSNRDGGLPTVLQYRSATPANLDAIAIVDLDGDGDLDLLQAADERMGGYLNNGDGTFTAHHFFDAGTEKLFGVAAADFNHDGKIDIVATEERGRVLVMLRDGESFTAGQTFGSDAGVDGPSRAAVADFDHDGWADIVFYNQGDKSVRVLHNVTQQCGLPDLAADGGVENQTLTWERSGCSCDAGGSGLLALLVLAHSFRRERSRRSSTPPSPSTASPCAPACSKAKEPST